MSRPPVGLSTVDRIFARIDVADCWEWQGYRLPAGHGRVRANGRKVLVHRWVWAHLVGPVGVGLELDHLCRNPPCTNPDHLQPVPHRINALRGVGVGARNSVKTHCAKRHAYTPENTYIDSMNRRVCRICRREWQRTYRSNRFTTN